MLKRLPFILILLLVFLAACASPVEETYQFRLPMGYIPNIQYAPFYVALENGYFEDEGFDVEFDYSFETDGITLVGTGELPFALVSGEQVLLARTQGLPVVYVMAWYQDYPVAVVASADSGVEVPADLVGQQIALPGLFGANYIGLRALLDSQGIEETDVTLSVVGFVQVQVFLAGQEDIVVGYVANEPVQLRAQGEEIIVFEVADYVQLAANGLITNEDLIQENPEMVQAFIDATLRGIEYSIENPEEAYQISMNYVEGLAELDYDVQMEILNLSIEFWLADLLGYSEIVAWENMEQVLLGMGLLESPLILEDAFTNEFIE